MSDESGLLEWQFKQRDYWNQREKRGWLLAVAPTDWMNALEERLVENGCSREQSKELVINVFSIIQGNLMEQVMLVLVQRWLLGQSLANESRHIVDVGVGTGEFAIRMVPLIVRRQYKYTGIDLAEDMISHTKERLRQAGYESPNIALVEGLATNLDLKNESVWLVAWGKFGEHLTNNLVWGKGLDEVKRVLEPGGYFLLYEPLQDFNKRYREQPRKSEGTLIRTQEEYDNALSPMKRVETWLCQFCEEEYSIALWQKAFILQQLSPSLSA